MEADMKKLKYGMVGGSFDSYIGDVHRQAARMDNLAELKAGNFSRNLEKSRKTAEIWDVDQDRIYGSWSEMAEKEALRGDGIDFVSIVTPNDSHYEIAKCFLEHGIPVICDKPVTFHSRQAEELLKISRDKSLPFAVTYGYTGYPIIRQAREMIEAGTIGELLYVRVRHAEDWVISSVDPESKEELPWRFHPEKVGAALCMGDIGTHAEQLLEQFTGLHIHRLLAMLGTWPKRVLPLETNGTVLLDLGDGIQGELWASQIAIGKTCSPGIFVIGSKGSLEWTHETPSILRYTPLNAPTQLLEAGRSYTSEDSQSLCRVSAAHNEGFLEAFGNIYRNFCEDLLAKKYHIPGKRLPYPTIRDGYRGMKFIEACVESSKKGNVWINLE